VKKTLVVVVIKMTLVMLQLEEELQEQKEHH
jgi:hypothetical protein